MPMIPVDTAVQLIVGPLVDDTDFKTLETGVAHNAAGMSVDFIKSSISGTPTKTDITLTTGSTQDWVELGNGMYYIEITAAQNDTEGEVQLVGVATGILPFASPRYQVVSQQVYNSLVAGSDTLNAAVTEWNGVALATTNPLPNAAPDAAGGLPVSDAGGLDLDGLNTNVSAILTDTGTAGVVVDWSAIVNPTATKSFTNTTIAVTSAVAGNVGGNVTGSIGSLAAQAKADVNAEVDAALDTAVPGTPTAGSINDILKDLDALLPGSGTLSTLDAAAVNAEVVDALTTDTYAEPGSVPAASASLATKIGWLYLLSRNKVTQTATTTTVRNDADSGNVATSTVSDDGTTFTRGEWS